MNTTEKPSLPLGDAETAQLLAFAEEQAQRVVSKIPLLGAVAWLMMQQPAMRHTVLSELEWRVMPPLMLEQAKIYLKDGAPIAYVSWGRLSESAAERYSTAPHHLGTTDWNSGEHIWIVDFVVPFGGSAQIIKELRETVFAGRAVNQLIPDTTGNPKTLTWPIVQASQ